MESAGQQLLVDHDINFRLIMMIVLSIVRYDCRIDMNEFPFRFMQHIEKLAAMTLTILLLLAILLQG